MTPPDVQAQHSPCAFRMACRNLAASSLVDERTPYLNNHLKFMRSGRNVYHHVFRGKPSVPVFIAHTCVIHRCGFPCSGDFAHSDLSTVAWVSTVALTRGADYIRKRLPSLLDNASLSVSWLFSNVMQQNEILSRKYRRCRNIVGVLGGPTAARERQSS